MNVVLVRLACATCVVLTFAKTADAETASIVAAADTTLSQRMPNNNLGGHSQILSGADGTGTFRRGLLSFDVAGSIPAGAIIDSATLTLVVNASNTNVSDFHLHRMLVDWTEGVGLTSQGAPALPGESTWNNRHHPATPWTAPGGAPGIDYLVPASATMTVNAAGPYSWVGLAADVQAMLNSPAQNHGWMLISDRELVPNTARQFESTESLTEAFPTLQVTYHQIPEPSSALLAIALLGLAAASTRRIRLRFRAPHYCITAK